MDGRHLADLRAPRAVLRYRPRPMVELSLPEARRLALASQSFSPARPKSVGRRELLRLVQRLGALQIDSVNVLIRSHYLPAFARLGAYARADLDALAWESHDLFEYWGHEASLLPVELWPLLRWRMERARRGEMWGGIARFGRERAAYVEEVFREVGARGPIAASSLEQGGKRGGKWWGWADGKRAMECLFWSGRVTASTRRNFERLYDLPERVLPPELLAAPVPPEDEAQRRLLVRASRALGIATARDLGDYFRIRPTLAKARIGELVELGELEPARVQGWREPAFLARGLRVAPSFEGLRALVSPFDSLIWERSRTERLFGFHFRLEFYVPAPKRVHGYYVMPFLLGDRLVGRVDLKAERSESTLLVHAAYPEKDVDGSEAATALAAQLRELADWLSLERIRIGRRGALATPLRRALEPASRARRTR